MQFASSATSEAVLATLFKQITKTKKALIGISNGACESGEGGVACPDRVLGINLAGVGVGVNLTCGALPSHFAK